MEEKISFSQVLHQYAVCMNRKCAKADSCLRQIVEKCIPAEVEHWKIISPKYLATVDAPCRHYRPMVKKRFAKGFIKILEELPHKQMQTVVSHLVSFFNLRTYYRVRKGERLLSPYEQQQFQKILKKCGVTCESEFDAYLEDYDW